MVDQEEELLADFKLAAQHVYVAINAFMCSINIVIP